MIRRVLPGVALAAVVALSLVMAGTGRSDGPRTAEARAQAIADDLRCPVCQGLSVADSRSDTASAMFEEIRRRVAAGESESQIKDYYVSRYGEWVLLDPRPTGIGTLVWTLPVGALLVAGGVLTLAFRRWRRRPALRATEADRALVEAALARRQGDDG